MAAPRWLVGAWKVSALSRMEFQPRRPGIMLVQAVEHSTEFRLSIMLGRARAPLTKNRLLHTEDGDAGGAASFL